MSGLMFPRPFGFLAAVLAAVALGGCAITYVSTQSSAVSGAAREVEIVDVVYLDQSSFRIGILKSASLGLRAIPSDGALRARTGDIVRAFGTELIGSFETVARASGVLRSVSVVNAGQTTQDALLASIASARPGADAVMAIAPASGTINCLDNRCSFEVQFNAILYDTLSRQRIWRGAHTITVIRNLSNFGEAAIELEPTAILESYWNAVFASLRSDRMVGKDIAVKLRPAGART